jgi:arsenite methyltransferase
MLEWIRYPFGVRRMQTVTAGRKVSYGIDAPGVIRNLALGGVTLFLIALFLPTIELGPVVLLTRPGFYIGAIAMFVPVVLMLLYSTMGKFRHRDRMIALAHLRGDEQVLDVGTGRGLLLAGAAKHLTIGRAVGIDIWSQKDLSSNNQAATQANLEAEGVADRCELRSEPAQAMRFSDGSMDAVFSLMCIHNIPAAAERDAACREIARVLKPGGVAVISDYKNTGRYADVFNESGLAVERKWFPFDTFPPVAVVVAKKGAGG